MAIPSQAMIEFPLLLELERRGGRVRTDVDFPAFYGNVARHFPDLTADDLKMRRQTGSQQVVWHNIVAWASNRLRAAGQLDSGQRGIWQITSTGQERLRKDLGAVGINSIEQFIKSNSSLPQEIGTDWRLAQFRIRGRSLQSGASHAPGSVPLRASAGTTSAEASQPRPRTEDLPEEANSTIRDQLLARLQSLDPAQFEYLIAELLEAGGFSEVRVTGKSGDGGVDGECGIQFLKLKCAFQAKRYASSNIIGAQAMRNFKGGVVGRFERGIFITTSNFSPGAIEEAEQPGVTLITMNGHQLANQLLELGLGVKTVPIVRHTLDEEFFSRLAR